MSYQARQVKIGGGSPKCPTCGKSVFFNEQVLAIEKAWHKRCLKCNQCGKVLDPGSLSDRDGKVYCAHCYSSVAGLKGYGHGTHSESHISGGAANVAPDQNAVVLQGADADTPTTQASSGNLGGAKFCARCGGARSEGAKFCAGCGNAF